MERMPYRIIAICPNAGQATFRAAAIGFIKRSEIFPSNLEGLSATKNGPQTHVLICFYATEAIVNNYRNANLSIANLFWWVIDLRSNTCVYKSVSAFQPPIGSYWDVDLAIANRNLNRLYNSQT